jgi:hypothetical protein
LTTLKTILYFSIFNYPVTKDEIYKYSSINNWKQINNEIDLLLNRRIIYKIDDYYLKTNSNILIKKRLNANLLAINIMPKALKVSRLISSFPYVKGVALSGGLSKGIYNSNDDIDFFIITSANKLWISRTLLVLYKKIVLLNSRKYFCVNYFIGSNDLEITEKNKFTAMELATLIPTHGKAIFEEFMKKNDWINKYFPNKNIKENFYLVKDNKKPFISRALEIMLDNKFGNLIDHVLRIITLYKWKIKFKSMSEDDFKIAMKTTKNVSKHHPQNYQKRIIDSLNENYSLVNKEYKISLEPEHA